MGFLNLFKPKPPPVATESVWISSQAKFSALKRDILASLKADAAVVLLAHFPDTLRQYQADLTATGFAFEQRPRLPASELDSLARAQNPGKLFTALTAALHFDALPDSKADRNITLLLSERHPLRAKDDAIEDFAGGVPTQLRIHVSLDDALLKQFAGPNILDILRKLGMDENQPIVSPTVTTAIRSAQQKIEAKATGDREASSPEEWLRLNCTA